MFSTAWNMISRLLPARTVKKVRFVTAQDTASTLMKYVKPHSIVALQRLLWGHDGDVICDDIDYGDAICEDHELHSANKRTTFEKVFDVHARSSESVYVALDNHQKCAWRLYVKQDGKEQDVTGFADVLYVSNEQNEGVLPDNVIVHVETTRTRGTATCFPHAKECLLVIACDNSNWFGSKTYRIDVEVLG
jgi:hypothetical protein